MLLKKQSINYPKPVFLVFWLFSICLSGVMSAQSEDDLFQSRLGINVVQLSDQTAQLKAKLRFRENRQYFNISGETILFTSIGPNGIVELGSASTDGDGEASISFDAFDDLHANEDSLYSFTALFDGSSRYEASDDEISVKRAILEVSSDVVDSICYLYINARELISGNAVGDQDVFVMIPRMFSNLTIFNDYTDEDGYLEVEFPDDIPSLDSEDLNVIVRIPDTDEYGTLEARLTVPWGKAVYSDNHVASGELWSQDPPNWMLITFIVLMSLVWGHFLVIVYKLFLVKREFNINKTQN